MAPAMSFLTSCMHLQFSESDSTDHDIFHFTLTSLHLNCTIYPTQPPKL